MVSCNELIINTSYIVSNQNLNDKLLILRARLGDKQAFASLYNKYVSKIYRFAYYKLGSKELAEDITSQSFLKLWERIVSGGQIKSLQALLYRITRNLIVDYYRSKQSTELPLEFESQIEGEPMKERLHANIDRYLLQESIAKLKEEYREVIILRYIEELSIAEISKIVDKSRGNIRTICHRAIKELQEILKDYDT